MLERGRAGEYHLTTMLKACAGCEQQVELVTRAEQAGMTTAAPTFTFLLGSAQLEGRTKDTAALQREMARRGIMPNEYTARVLGRTPEVLSRQRTAELGRLLKAGEASRAWALFDGLLERGHADVVQQHGQSAPLAVPQLGFCASSGRAWQLWLAQRSHGRDRSTGRSATASGALASRLQSRRFPCL